MGPRASARLEPFGGRGGRGRASSSSSSRAVALDASAQATARIRFALPSLHASQPGAWPCPSASGAVTSSAPGTLLESGPMHPHPAARRPTAVPAGSPAAAPRPARPPPRHASRTRPRVRPSGGGPAAAAAQPSAAPRPGQAAPAARARRRHLRRRWRSLGLAGFVTVVGAALIYSEGLPPADGARGDRLPRGHPSSTRATASSLARLTSGGERRTVIEWDQVPPILADAATAVEDKTFWTNTGIDPLGIASAALDTLTGDARGGSTITQQLVRQKLLPEAVMQESSTPRRAQDRGAHPVGPRHRLLPRPRGQAGAS